MNVQFLMKNRDSKVANQIFNRRLFNESLHDLVLLVSTEDDGDIYVNISKILPYEDLDSLLAHAANFVRTCKDIEEKDANIYCNLYQFLQYCVHKSTLEDIYFAEDNIFYEVGDLAAWAQETCEDCGEIPANLPWYIADNIDWSRVANELLQDYEYITMDNGNYLLVQAA